jgi:hypothetical protein
MSSTGDQLLTVLSARREMSWGTFKTTFDVLHSKAVAAGEGVDEPVGLARQKSIRLLLELGHADMLTENRSMALFATPTCLAKIPMPGLPRVVLCGSRGPEAMARLRDACRPEKSNMRVVTVRPGYTGGYAPTAVLVEGTDLEMLGRVADRASITLVPDPPAWSILSYAGGVNQYLGQVEWSNEPDPNWHRRDFNPDTLCYGLSHTDDSFVLSEFQSPTTKRLVHRLRRGEMSATVDRDWGRWILLERLRKCVVVFDSDSQTLAVPATVPVPILLGRALCLLTGVCAARVTDERTGKRYDVYSGVSPDVAQTVMEKLGQHTDDLVHEG